MSKKILALLVLIVVIVLAVIAFFFRSNNSVTPLTLETPKDVVPSDTFIDYTDPAGFSFSYPDNISISNKAVSEDAFGAIDPDVYSQLQLFSKDKSGSLNIKISDSEFDSLDEWLKANKIPETNTPAEKQLGSLKAIEVRTSDRLMLASLDQGVLFTVDMPLVEQNFWMKVYDKVIKDFAFAAPETATAQAPAAASGDVIFEGEEVVE